MLVEVYRIVNGEKKPIFFTEDLETGLAAYRANAEKMPRISIDGHQLTIAEAEKMANRKEQP